MKIFGEMNGGGGGGGGRYFSHMAPPPKVEYYYANDSGRIVLITITLNGQKLSLCNIYAPNMIRSINSNLCKSLTIAQSINQNSPR